ncbi:MAG: putative inorganic carbon ((-)) transporter [Thermoleophilaceae bacterium]|nr:putative inorganic carbon ((-)) transporter [Thermoleophilaceae bacterium]
MLRRLTAQPTHRIVGTLLLAAVIAALLGWLAPAAIAKPFFILVGVLAAAAGAYLFWSIDPAWSISAGVALAVFNGNWSHVGLPGGAGLAPDRALLALGILSILVRGPGARNRPAVPTGPAHWALVAAAVYAIGSAIWAGTVFDKAGGFLLIDRFTLMGFVLFTVAPVAFVTERQRQIFLMTLVGLGAYLGSQALFQTINADALVFPKYILDPSIGFHVDRARGPFVEAEANGLALFACTVAAVIAAVTWKRSGARWIAVIVAGLCAAGCLFTLSRAIWIGSVVGAMVALAAFAELRRFIVPVMTGALLLVITAFAMVPGLQEKASARRQSKLPVYSRVNTNTAAINMIEDKPLLGFGWGRYSTESLPYFWQAPNTPLFGTTANVHNVVLLNTVELGLVGAGLWLLAVLLAVGGAVIARGPPELRPWRIGLLAIAVQFAIVLNLTPLVYVFPNILLLLWAGVTLSWRARPAVAPGRDVVAGRPLARGSAG